MITRMITHLITNPILRVPAAALSRALVAAALCASASACVETVDVGALEVDGSIYSIAGYQSWYSVEVSGIAPGHGDSFRRIFVNDAGRSYGHVGEYPDGTVLVKDIYELAGGSQQGAYSYSAVMRKIAPDDVPGGIELEGGWLFTFLEEARGEGEFTIASCYGHCHVQAPIDYVWYDYGI